MAKENLSKWGHGVLVLSLLFVGLTVAALFLSRIMAKDFVVHGVYIKGNDLSGMTYDEASDVVIQSSDELFDQRLVLKLNDLTRSVSLDEIGVRFDKQETFNRIFDVSYGQDLSWHIRTRFLGMTGKQVNVKPVIEIDKKEFVKGVRDLFPEVQSPRDARIVVDAGGEITVYGHQFGMAVDYDEAYEKLKLELESGEIDDIDLGFRLLRVNYLESEAKDDAEILKAILGKEIVLKDSEIGFEKTFVVTADWLNVYKGQIDFADNFLVRLIKQDIEPEIGEIKQDIEIVKLPDSDVGYVEVKGKLIDGRMVKVSDTIDNISLALSAGKAEAELEIIETKGSVINKTGEDMGDLEFLARGRSNFQGSTAGRAFNVRKGIDEKMNDIVIAPGATFSFNEFLGPVTYRAGWQAALAIFNGKDLEPVPGGGLCQVSTTVYRAALNAGLEIAEQRNHSLYVHYYRDYGNGLDATIYPGQQDLKFVNNTGEYLFLRSWTDGDNAYVDFYGTDDGREVELIGPIYKGEVPEEYADELVLGNTQIAWIYKVKMPDGSTTEKILKSSYRNSIMR